MENKGLNMGVNEYFMCMLELEKNMSNNYSYAMNEASNDDLYEDFFDMFAEIKDMVRDIFLFLEEKGAYPLTFVNEDKVQNDISKLQNKLSSIENNCQ